MSNRRRVRNATSDDERVQAPPGLVQAIWIAAETGLSLDEVLRWQAWMHERELVDIDDDGVVVPVMCRRA